MNTGAEKDDAVGQSRSTDGLGMSDKEYVLSICKNAWAYRCGQSIYEVSNPTPNGAYPIGEGKTEQEAWADAAKRLCKPNIEVRGCANTKGETK